MEMALKMLEAATTAEHSVRQTRRRAEADQADRQTTKNMAEVVRDHVELHRNDQKAPEQPVAPEKHVLGGGNLYDYRVDSENDLVISVKSRDTQEEIKQIPSREAQAVRRAYHKVVDKLIDKTA